MSHVFLIGFMGSGKSTVGMLVAERLELPFVDIDERIAARGQSIAELFASDGEKYFRALEREQIRTLADEPASVVACGGGLVTVPGAGARLRELGTVVYLRTTAAEAISRIGDVSSRPLLDGPDPLEAAETLLEARSEHYEQAADFEVDTVGRSAEQVADEVAGLVVSAKRRRRPAIVKVPIAGSEYEVVIGPGVSEDIGELVRIVAPESRNVAVITDSNVGDMYGITVERKLIEEGYSVHPLAVAAGEGSKSWQVAGELLEALAETRLDRGDLVVALGGGVIGDLAGFTAATYLRGIKFVQVPTTLLAQVDSSVGGKTGVDLRAGKNLAGAFKQPLLVVADTSTLVSLPESEWASGLAEIAKGAVIDGEEFLVWLEDNVEALLRRDESVVVEAVRRSVAFKAGVVSADETEAGPRECLNYGHTFGHAVEKVSGYGHYSHGLAVAEGMRFAARLAVEVCGADIEMVDRQDELLDRLGLTAIPDAFASHELMSAMHSDKKVKQGTVRFVLLSEPGDWQCISVDDTVIAEHVAAWSASKRGR